MGWYVQVLATFNVLHYPFTSSLLYITYITLRTLFSDNCNLCFTWSKRQHFTNAKKKYLKHKIVTAILAYLILTIQFLQEQSSTITLYSTMIHDSNSISKNICFFHKVCCNKNGSLTSHILMKKLTNNKVTVENISVMKNYLNTNSNDYNII